MSWDVDEKEFYETFAEIAADPNRGLHGGVQWAWSALHWTQQELRERDKENQSLRGERAAVVAWLRAHANAPHPIERGVPSLSPAGRGLLLLHADRIERGEHRREERT